MGEQRFVPDVDRERKIQDLENKLRDKIKTVREYVLSRGGFSHLEKAREFLENISPEVEQLIQQLPSSFLGPTQDFIPHPRAFADFDKKTYAHVLFDEHLETRTVPELLELDPDNIVLKEYFLIQFRAALLVQKSGSEEFPGRAMKNDFLDWLSEFFANRQGPIPEELRFRVEQIWRQRSKDPKHAIHTRFTDRLHQEIKEEISHDQVKVLIDIGTDPRFARRFINQSVLDLKAKEITAEKQNVRNLWEIYKHYGSFTKVIDTLFELHDNKLPIS